MNCMVVSLDWASGACMSRKPQGMPNTLWTSASQNLIFLLESKTMDLVSRSILFMIHLLHFRLILVSRGNFSMTAKPISSTRKRLYSNSSEVTEKTFWTEVREVVVGPSYSTSSSSRSRMLELELREGGLLADPDICSLQPSKTGDLLNNHSKGDAAKRSIKIIRRNMSWSLRGGIVLTCGVFKKRWGGGWGERRWGCNCYIWERGRGVTPS